MARETFRSLNAIESECLEKLNQTGSVDDYLHSRLQETVCGVQEYIGSISHYSAVMISIREKLSQSITVEEFRALASEDSKATDEVKKATAIWRAWRETQPQDMEALAHWQDVSRTKEADSDENISAALARIADWESPDGEAAKIDNEVYRTIQSYENLLTKRTVLTADYDKALRKRDVSGVQHIQALTGGLRLFADDRVISEQEEEFRMFAAVRSIHEKAKTAIAESAKIMRREVDAQQPPDRPSWAQPSLAVFRKAVHMSESIISNSLAELRTMPTVDGVEKLTKLHEKMNIDFQEVLSAWKKLEYAGKSWLSQTALLVVPSCFALLCILLATVYWFYEPAINEPLKAEGLASMLFLFLVCAGAMALLTPLGWIPAWFFYRRRKSLLRPAHEALSRAVYRLAADTELKSIPENGVSNGLSDEGR